MLKFKNNGKTLLKSICASLLNVSIMFLSSCTIPPKTPSSTANTTFTIETPKNFDCYTQHQGTTKISVFLDLTIYYYDGTKKVTLDDKTLLVNPNTTPFPVTMTALTPTDGTVAYWELNVVGQQCSECANLWSDPNEYPYGSCPANMIDPNNPNSYIAAKPRWLGTNIIQYYVTTLDVGTSRFMNVPNSCGCEVQ